MDIFGAMIWCWEEGSGAAINRYLVLAELTDEGKERLERSGKGLEELLDVSFFAG